MSKANFILSDHYEDWINLNPLTLTKPIACLRIGITSIKEKWEHSLKQSVHIKTCISYLECFNNFEQKKGEIYFFINSSCLPNELLIKQILSLETGTSLYKQGVLIASKICLGEVSFEEEKEFENELIKISYPWDIFKLNHEVLVHDFSEITLNRTSEKLSATNLVIGDMTKIFIEEGAYVEGATLNTMSGPIYVGRNAEIMEGSMVRGALALCEGSSLKLGTKIYGATTIGPHSRVGGEVSNSLIQGYSNKGHDGFLGNSVIGEWCNLGADTNNSNLKNNYSEVKVYNYQSKSYINSQLQFLGLIMGDHSKSGINTMFNTGTVVGVFANIFGSNFPPKHIPSFSWGGAEGFEKFDFHKAIEVAERVMERRHVLLSEEQKSILNFIHQTTEVK